MPVFLAIGLGLIVVAIWWLDHRARVSAQESRAVLARAMAQMGVKEGARLRLDDFVGRAEILVMVLAFLGTIQARDLGVPWSATLSGAVAYIVLSLMALRRLRLQASRSAAFSLLATGVGFPIFIKLLARVPDWDAEWLHFLVVAGLASMLGLKGLDEAARYRHPEVLEPSDRVESPKS